MQYQSLITRQVAGYGIKCTIVGHAVERLPLYEGAVYVFGRIRNRKKTRQGMLTLPPIGCTWHSPHSLLLQISLWKPSENTSPQH